MVVKRYRTSSVVLCFGNGFLGPLS